MKTKHLLPVLAMLMLTTLAAIAQETANKPNSLKDNIPFGKKLPPPDRTHSPVNSSQQTMQHTLNASLMHGIKMHDINAIKKSLDDYRLQLKDKRTEESVLFPPTVANRIRGGFNNSDFHLTKDINALAESNPRNNPSLLTDIHWNVYNDSASYAVLNNVAYFVADDGIHGNEFWRSNGTAAGTYMVKDIAPGGSSSAVFDITAVNGKIYFTDYSTGGAWVSDGTESGTQLLISLSEPVAYFTMGAKTYFIADGTDIWTAIWETDGTAAGTKQVVDLGDKGFWISEPTVANGLFFFTAFNFETGGWDFWRSNGSDTGTYSVASFPAFDSIPAQLTNYHNKLYFSASDGTGRKLWVSDGTMVGTTPAPGNHDVIIDADILGTSFPILNNVLYIPGEETSIGNGLYKYDASDAAGVIKIKDFAPVAGTAFIVPFEMQVVNNTVYFKVTNYNGGVHDELWSSKGTSATTQLAYKLLRGETIKNLYNGSGIFYFVKSDKFLGSELWRTLETPFGIFPLPVGDIFRGSTGSYPSYLTAFNGKLIFSATDELKGNELFMTNGFAFGFGARIVKDINTVSTGSSNAGFYIDALTPLGNDVLFNAFEKVRGRELYKSDGTASGTFLLNDIVPGETGSNPGNMLSKNNFDYFTASSSDTTFSIFKTNGSKNGLQKVAPDYNTSGYFMSDFKVADNSIVFYVVYSYNAGSYQLWRSDGTTAGTLLLSSTIYHSDYLNVSGNIAFFVGGDATHGYELWKSDGTEAGTQMVKDINPGIGNSGPKGMFVYKNEVYFAANNGTDASFWKSNGTESGTIQLAVTDSWYGSTVFSNERYSFAISNNVLYFSAIDYANSKGTQLWKTNGTVAGTQVVKDISPDANSFYPVPTYFKDVNGTLFFIGDDGVHGTELWKSDGTENGTQMVKDITPGADPSTLNNLVNFGDKLFFTNNGILWSSDGTADGTIQVEDPVINNVVISNIVASRNQLFLSGYTSKYGIELYTGKVNTQTGKVVMSGLANEKTLKISSPFNVVLYPNPSISNATLQITGSAKNIFVSITDMSGRKLWQTRSNNAMFINLPTGKFAAGTYIVTITNDQESQVIKLLRQ